MSKKNLVLALALSVVGLVLANASVAFAKSSDGARGCVGCVVEK